MHRAAGNVCTGAGTGWRISQGARLYKDTMTGWPNDNREPGWIVRAALAA